MKEEDGTVGGTGTEDNPVATMTRAHNYSYVISIILSPKLISDKY